MRSRLFDVVQIAAILFIVAGHTGVRGTASAQCAVELFLVIAGFNMARHLDRYESTVAYALSRIQRLAPEVFVVWCLTLVLFLFGLRNPGVAWFLLATPLFLENLVEPFLLPEPGVDYVFVCLLWFVAALVQLQVLLFMLRRIFTRYTPLTLVLGTVCVGVAFRALIAFLHGSLTRNLQYATYDEIYRLPLTHIEAITFGLMLGLGLLPKIGRWGPALAGITLGAGAISYALTHGEIPGSSLGFPVGLRYNFQYLWGYPLLALMLAAWIAPDGVLARVGARVWRQEVVSRLCGTFASLTYGVYVFHGLFLSAIERGIWVRGLRYTGWLRVVVFLEVSGAAFACSWLFQHARAWLSTRLASPSLHTLAVKRG